MKKLQQKMVLIVKTDILTIEETTESGILESMESKELLLHYQEIKKKHVGSI